MSGPPAPTAATSLYLLLGDPVAHSLSPVFQNAAMRAAGIDATYAALRCDLQSVAPLIRALCRAGGGGNITVPHKAAAAECVEVPTAAVLRTGACNTFWSQDGRIHGDNTDVEGFLHATQAVLPSLAGTAVLVVGAGGAAAAAVCALLEAGAVSISLINRSPDRARWLAGRMDPDGGTVRVITSVRDIAGADFDLVVNATSLGLHPDDPLPLDLAALGRVRAALDLVYRSGGSTPWVRHARRLGCVASDGTGMLLGQGAAAFARWFGSTPPIEVMRDALGLTNG